MGVSGKVKRVRNNPSVKMAPCTMRGNVLGEWMDARAKIVTGEEAAFGMQLLNKKYFPWKQLVGFFASFSRRERTVFVLRPALARVRRWRDKPIAGTILTGPQPAKGAGGQQAVDESVEGFLEDHTPGLALPDAIDQGSQGVCKERGGASDAKHGQIVRAGRNRASREIGHEEADKQAIGEPHAEELWHGDWAAGKHG